MIGVGAAVGHRNTHDVFFFGGAVLTDDGFGNASVLSQNQKAGGVDVQTTGRNQAL